MKEKIITLIIGMLIGAVITATIFNVFKKDTSGRPDMGEKPNMTQMEGEGFRDRRERPNSNSSEESNTVTTEENVTDAE